MKMLKHLFGKRDKELDVLQEEALQSPLRTVVRNFTSNRLAFGGLIVFLVIFLIVLIGPVFNPIDLSEYDESAGWFKRKCKRDFHGCNIQRGR